MISKFNGTSTPKGSYRAKTGDNDCQFNSSQFIVNSSRYSLRTTPRESIRYQAKSEQNIQQNQIPRVHHGEAALCTPQQLGEWYVCMLGDKPPTSTASAAWEDRERNLHSMHSRDIKQSFIRYVLQYSITVPIAYIETG